MTKPEEGKVVGNGNVWFNDDSDDEVWMVVRRWRCTVMMMVGSVIPVIVPVIQYDARVE